MFDLKKRHSLSLTVSRETEEFRRAAVRRRSKEVNASTDSSGVCGSYSSGGSTCEWVSGSEANSKSCIEEERSPTKRSHLKPQAAHLQSPPSAAAAQAHSPPSGTSLPPYIDGIEQNKSPNRCCSVYVSCDSSALSCPASPSPVRGGGNHFLDVSGGHISPARHTLGISKRTSSPIFESPSPGRRSLKSCSLLRAGGVTPTKLFPRTQSFSGKLRTPSPVQGRSGSYSPAKNSKSWLGLNRIQSGQKEVQEKNTGKSFSVPDLTFYLEENRPPSKRTDRSPLKLLQSPNCTGPAIPIRAPVTHALNRSINGVHPSKPGQMDEMVQGKDCAVANGTGINERVDESKTSLGYDSMYFCKWDEASTDDGRIHKEPKEEEPNGETGSGGGAERKDETEQKLFRIANELLQTERAYVGRLHLLDQVFCARLTEEAGRGSFPPEVIRGIFSNISSIHSFHSKFLLPDLENCISHWKESPGLGSVLLQHAPFLRMYGDYVSNFEQATELVRSWTERSAAFRNTIQDIQSREVCGSLTMQHHMLEPVQRLPRYEMMLRDYLKKLPEDNPDYELSQKSLQTISMAATHSNSAIHKAERLKRLLEIYEMVGEEEVVNPTNEFLKEGRLFKLAARNASPMERHLFLFNNFLLCCTPKFSLVSQRFTVRCRIGVEGMQVKQTSNEAHPNTFQVSGKEKFLELQASSEQDQVDWIKVIQGAIDEFQKKNESFKLASRELNIDERTEELGRRAPCWTRDSEVTSCKKCKEPFNALTRRRHHCRACGCVVCSKCSDNKVALEYDNNKLNKVCKACYSILSGKGGKTFEGKKRRILEPAPSPVSSGFLMSGVLMYSCIPKTNHQVWAAITRTEPTVLSLYAAPQDVKPLSLIPLEGCSLHESPQELQGQHCFCVSQPQVKHSFSCDGSDLKQSWLTALRACTLGGYDTSTNASTCGINATADDGGVPNGEAFLIGGNKESNLDVCD